MKTSREVDRRATLTTRPGFLPLPILCLALSAGCALTGTRTKTAEAIDFREVAGSTSLSGGAPQASMSAAARPSRAYRYRFTSTAALPPTAKQRAAAIVGTVGGVGVVALIALIIICPGALAAFALRTAAKWRTATRQIVRGIRDADTVARDAPTHDALAASTDDRTKKLIAEAKYDS